MEEYTLDGRLLTLLAQPLRIEEIRRALPDIGKHELKDALDRLTQDGKIMKNKKNRFAVASHYGCATGTFLATERALPLSRPTSSRMRPNRTTISFRRTPAAAHGTATGCSSRSASAKTTAAAARRRYCVSSAAPERS